MKQLALLLGLLILTAHGAIASESAPSAHVNYQGKLTTATGAPVSDGAHSITFRLFQVEAGGTALWEQTESVQTTGGLFSTVIGPVPGEIFRSTLGAASDLWLEIVADGSMLSPRTKVTGAPYSTVAGFALDLPNNLIVSAHIKDGVITSAKIADGTIGASDLIPSYADGSAYDSRFVRKSGDTMNGNLAISGSNSLYLNGTSVARFNNDGTYTNYWGPAPLRIQDAVAGFYNYAGKQYWGYSGHPQAIDYYMDGGNYLKLFLGGTQVGDISASDTSWLRLNANSAANVYTPRLLRADGGLFVGGTTYGVDASGKVISPQVDASVFRDRDSTSYTVDLSGISTLNDVRADRFASRQDPANYYLDPDGASRLNNVEVSGVLAIPADSVTTSNLSASGSTSGQVLTSNGTSVEWTTPSPGDGSAYDSRFVNASGDMMTGSLSTSGALSAGLLYDTGNTSYYVDPAGTSRLYNIRVGSTSGVSEDVQTGLMWFDGTQYGIFRESGAWTSPYPGLRIAFHTGVKIGASSAYGGTRFFNSSDMATEILSVGSGDNNVRVNYDLYSPVLHDKDDPGYYVDPAGTSNVNNLTVNGTISAPAGKPELPVAYAYINSDGTKASGTSNLTSVWNSGLGLERYEITLAGEYYFLSSYVTTVTPSASSSVRIPTTTASSGKLFVQMYDLSGNKVQSAFQLVIYKP